MSQRVAHELVLRTLRNDEEPVPHFSRRFLEDAVERGDDNLEFFGEGEEK